MRSTPTLGSTLGRYLWLTVHRDENLSAAVRETFVTLFDEGTIYRANRLVNHCCALNTALSNLEVENVELEGRTMLDVPGYDKKIEFGVMHYFYYPIEGTEEKIEVGTTRIETMVGDTGIGEFWSGVTMPRHVD